MPEAMARRFGETLAECQYEQWYDHTEDVCGHIESFRVKIVERTSRNDLRCPCCTPALLN